MGNTLPPPPWTQRKVHSQVLRHGGDTAKSVCSLSRGRVPDSSPWIVCFLFLQLLFSLLNHPLFIPHFIQVLMNPVALPPPLLFHIFAKVSLNRAWIVCLQHAVLWQGWRHCKEVPKSLPPLTQRRVHCPVQSHGSCHCKELSPPYQEERSWQHKMDWRVLFFSTIWSVNKNNPLFPYTNSVPQEPCQHIDNLPRLLLHFLSR